MNEQPGFYSDVLKLGLGILLGGVLLWGLAEYRANYLASKLEKQLQIQLDKQAAAAERQWEMLERRRQRSAQQQEARQQAAVLDQRQRIADEERKLAAWTRYYKPEPECLVAVSVECGNAHIRAWREFERLYAAGQL